MLSDDSAACYVSLLVIHEYVTVPERGKARFMSERAVCDTAIVRDTPMFHVCIF